MSSIQNILDPRVRDLCSDFDQMKAYEVTNEGGIYKIKRIKSDVSLETLKKMTSLILEGKIWLKEGKKSEGRRFVGKHINAEQIKQIIVDKSGNKKGLRADGVINVDMVDFGEITDEKLNRFREISEGLKKVFERADSPVSQKVQPVAKRPIVEDVSKMQAPVKNPTTKAKTKSKIELPSAQIIIAQAKEKKHAAKIKKEKQEKKELNEKLDQKSDMLRHEALKIDVAHQAIAKRSRVL